MASEPDNARNGAQPRTLVIGDSHVVALKRALREDTGAAARVTALRRVKEKNGTLIGDIRFEDFVERAAALAPQDRVVSALGGHQHSLVGLVQHPQPFDFHSPERPDLPPLPGREIIPHAVMHALMTARVQGYEGEMLPALASRTPATVLHLAPPPPNQDAGYILQRPDSVLVRKGIATLGTTPASIRQKLWTLQLRVLRELCPQWGVVLLPVPADCQTADGFLRPDFYGADATHANALYGQRLLASLFAGVPAAAAAPAGSSTERTLGHGSSA